MRGAAATDGSVPLGQRPVQQSRGDLTRNLVFPDKTLWTCDMRTHVSSGFRARLMSVLLLGLQRTLSILVGLVENRVIVLDGS